MSDVTQILQQIESGDPSAAEELLPLVYEELRNLAIAKMSAEKPGQTLQATALVHEAYLRLVDVERAQEWDSRGHFFSAAAEAIDPTDESASDDLLALDEALVELESEDERAAQVVKLRYFAGLTIQQTAEALGISVDAVNQNWAFARATLYHTTYGDAPHQS